MHDEPEILNLGLFRLIVCEHCSCAVIISHPIYSVYLTSPIFSLYKHLYYFHILSLIIQSVSFNNPGLFSRVLDVVPVLAVLCCSFFLDDILHPLIQNMNVYAMFHQEYENKISKSEITVLTYCIKRGFGIF